MVSVASSIHPGAGNMYMCIIHARLWIIVSQLLCGWVQCTPSASPLDNSSQPFLCKACSSGDGGRRCPAPLRSYLRTAMYFFRFCLTGQRPCYKTSHCRNTPRQNICFALEKIHVNPGRVFCLHRLLGWDPIRD